MQKGEPIFIKFSNKKRLLSRKNFLCRKCLASSQETIKGDRLPTLFYLMLFFGTGANHYLDLYFCSQMESVCLARCNSSCLGIFFTLHLLQLFSWEGEGAREPTAPLSQAQIYLGNSVTKPTGAQLKHLTNGNIHTSNMTVRPLKYRRFSACIQLLVASSSLDAGA